MYEFCFIRLNKKNPFHALKYALSSSIWNSIIKVNYKKIVFFQKLSAKIDILEIYSNIKIEERAVHLRVRFLLVFKSALNYKHH